MKIAICDDNEAERSSCQHRLEQLAQSHHIDLEIELYQKGEELLFHLEDVHRQPDIIYLDMRMGGMSGDEVAKVLRDQSCRSELIFFTVSEHYYASAFDVRAFHYIVKGQTDDKKFEKIFLSAVKASQDKSTEYIMCSGAGEFRNIEIRKIQYFQVVKRIITVLFGEQEEFSFYSTIGKIEVRLKDYGFIRIHRSYLVSAAYVRQISYHEVILQSGEELPVGRSYYAELKKAMEEYSANK